MHLKSNNLIANDASNILLMKVCLSYWLENYCNVTANMVKIDRKMANSPLNATPLHPHCNLVAPPLKTA